MAPYSALIPDLIAADQRGAASGWMGILGMMGMWSIYTHSCVPDCGIGFVLGGAVFGLLLPSTGMRAVTVRWMFI